MSILKKGLKYLNPIKAFKSTVKFVKKRWKLILIVALIVFTAGIATVGVAGFTGAMTAAGGGFGGFMSAVGSTMYAGIGAIGATFGVGAGAQGTAAAAGGVQGMGLGGGHLAAALGSKTAAAGIASQTALSAGISPLATSVGLGAAAPVAAVINPATGLAVNSGAAGMFSAAGPAVAPVVAGGGGSGLLGAAAITTGGQMLSGYAAGKAAKEPDPLGFWGVDMTGKGEDVFYSPPGAPPDPASYNQQMAANAPMSPAQMYQMQQMGLMNQNGNGPPQQQAPVWAQQQQAGYG